MFFPREKVRFRVPGWVFERDRGAMRTFKGRPDLIVLPGGNQDKEESAQHVGDEG